MSARFATVFSRLSIVSVALASAVVVTACNGSASTTSPPQTAPAETAQASQVTPAAKHAPGHWMFKRVQALDLRPEQQATVTEIQENLRADLTPHKETLRQIARNLADGIEAGHLDAADAASHQAALTAALADAKTAFATAMNSVHDTLDASQRSALVAQLQAEHEGRATSPDAQTHQGPLAKIAFELGLSDAQKASLHDAVQQGADDLFPDRKSRREAQEAQMKAMAQAFISEDFDAESFDLGHGMEQSVAAFSTVATRAIDVSEQVLSLSQRQAVASMVRSHAAEL
jgi:hypothetical protein